jgi:hypothetical protein
LCLEELLKTNLFFKEWLFSSWNKFWKNVVWKNELLQIKTSNKVSFRLEQHTNEKDSSLIKFPIDKNLLLTIINQMHFDCTFQWAGKNLRNLFSDFIIGKHPQIKLCFFTNTNCFHMLWYFFLNKLIFTKFQAISSPGNEYIQLSRGREP